MGEERDVKQIRQPKFHIGDSVNADMTVQVLNKEHVISIVAYIVGVGLTATDGGIPIYVYTLTQEPIGYSNYVTNTFTKTEKELG